MVVPAISLAEWLLIYGAHVCAEYPEFASHAECLMLLCKQAHVRRVSEQAVQVLRGTVSLLTPRGLVHFPSSSSLFRQLSAAHV